MYNFIKFVPAILAILSTTMAAVIPGPVIDNPCQVADTSSGTPESRPLREQIQNTKTAAGNADTQCQNFKEALKTQLTVQEILSLDGPLENVPGLPLGGNEPALNSTNVFAQKLRHSGLNITITYNILEQFVLGRLSQTFGQQINNLTSAMLTVKCKVTQISDLIESHFTTEEAHVDQETEMADYQVFTNLEEAISQRPMPSDEKEAVYIGYTAARYVQMFIEVLISVLDAQGRASDQK